MNIPNTLTVEQAAAFRLSLTTWMHVGKLSDGKAADLLGVSRIHLLQILAGNRVPTQGECERMTSVMQNI